MIPTTVDCQVNIKQYRYPTIHREEMQKQVDKLLKDGLIESSTSPYNAP